MISVQLATTGPNKESFLKEVEAYLIGGLEFIAVSEGHYRGSFDFVNDMQSFEALLSELNEIESRWYPFSQFVWIGVKSDFLSLRVRREI
jgi:hypothetical protein